MIETGIAATLLLHDKQEYARLATADIKNIHTKLKTQLNRQLGSMVRTVNNLRRKIKDNNHLLKWAKATVILTHSGYVNKTIDFKKNRQEVMHDPVTIPTANLDGYKYSHLYHTQK